MELHVRETISAAHALPTTTLSWQNNHKCAKLHGHTWLIEVALQYTSVEEALKNPVDVLEIKQIIKQLDHNNLTNIIEIPTMEGIVVYLMNQFKNKWQQIKNVEVTVWESENCYVRGGLNEWSKTK